MANPKSSKAAYGAESSGNVLYFDPEKLKLVEDKDHPLYDERVHLPLDEATVRNIMHYGVQVAITVMKDTETGEVLVVAGRQRVKHAREANKRLIEQGRPPIQVPAIPRRGSMEDAFDLVVIENEIRQNDTPLERANKMAKMIGHGRSEEQVALAFGCSEQTVKISLSLLECCAAVRKAVDTGKINLGHAKALAKMEPAEQQAKLEELLAAGASATGHERARKQRAVVDAKPKMKTRKEILEAIEQTKHDAAKRALRWVLGEPEPQ